MSYVPSVEPWARLPQHVQRERYSYEWEGRRMTPLNDFLEGAIDLPSAQSGRDGVRALLRKHICSLKLRRAPDFGNRASGTLHPALLLVLLARSRAPSPVVALLLLLNKIKKVSEEGNGLRRECCIAIMHIVI